MRSRAVTFPRSSVRFEERGAVTGCGRLATQAAPISTSAIAEQPFIAARRGTVADPLQTFRKTASGH
jgi:hypothetical protein